MAKGKRASVKWMSKMITWVCALVSVGIVLYFCWSYGLEPYLIRQGERQAVMEASDHWSAPLETAHPQVDETIDPKSLQPAQGEQAEEKPLSEPKEELPIKGEAALPAETKAPVQGERLPDYHQDYDEQELSGEAPMAVVRVPRWGDDYEAAMLNSVENEALRQTIGHYAFSAMPGECGNCVMAAHRSKRGGLFSRITELQPGDKVIIETRDWVFTYELYCEAELVKESKVDEIAAIPHHDGFTSYERYITLQACEIGYNHMRRLVVHGKLIDADRKA